jgi:enoyl-CoA hydratase/carnithine racemase
MPETVLLNIQDREVGRVAFVTLNNPGRLNALDSHMMEAFAGLVEELAGDSGLRALVLTGAGKRAFIGGADINEMAAFADPAAARAFITRVHRCCAALRDLPVPTLARIQGFTFGAGLEVAAACDHRIAAEGAVFGMPEVRLGIPSVVEAALLPQLIGWGRTRELLLFGADIPAGQALAWGLVEQVVPADALDAAVETRLAQLALCTPGAVRLQKSLIRAWEDLPLREAIAAGIDSFEAAAAGGEPAVAMAGFLERRRREKVARS